MKHAVMTTDHNDAGPLEEAVAWFVDNHQLCERPFIPALRRRFGLSAREAIHVMRIANLRTDWQGGANAATSS